MSVLHLSFSLLFAVIVVDAQRSSSRQRLDPPNTDLWRGHQKFDPECTNLQFLDAHQALKIEVSDFKGRMIIEIENHQEETDKILEKRKNETDEKMRIKNLETDGLLLQRNKEMDKSLLAHKEEQDKALAANLKNTTTSVTNLRSEIQNRNQEIDRRFTVLTGGVDVDEVQSMGTVKGRVDNLEQDLAREINTLRNEMNNKYNPLKAAHEKLQRDFNELEKAHNELEKAHNTLKNWLQNAKFPHIENNYAPLSKVYTRSQASQLFYSKNWLNNKFVTFRRDSNQAYVAKGTLVTDVQDVVDSVEIDEEDIDYLEQLEDELDDTVDEFDDTLDELNDTVDEVEKEVTGLVDNVGNLFNGFGRR